MNKISFVVLTYNSNIKKLKQTLFSIISQNNIDYEITSRYKENNINMK